MSTTDRSPGAASRAPVKRPGLREALVAFKYPNFARFWVGALLSNSGTWVQNVTIPYVVFQLTGSAFLVGITAALQFLPFVVMGPVGGSLADRFHRRSVLMVTQLGQAGIALLLWFAWVTEHRSIGVIIGLVLLSGLLNGINAASWQAFVSELVPREALLNAVTLNSTQFNAARAFGPALGGLVLGYFGVSWAFLVNAVSYLAVLVALLTIHVPRLEKKHTGERAMWRDFVDSLRYARRRPGILACLIVVSALGGLASPMVQLFPMFARDVFHVDEVAYGFLGASLGIGSVLAAPFIAGRGSGVRRSHLAGVAMLAYSLAIVAFGLAPVYAVAFASMLVAGAGYLALASTLNTTIQLQVDEVMRGKVLAVYVMFLASSLPVGVFIQGFLAQVVGPRFAVVVFGLLFLGVTAWLHLRTDMLSHLDDERREPAAA